MSLNITEQLLKSMCNLPLHDEEKSWSKHEVISYIHSRQQQLRDHTLQAGDKILIATGRGNLYWLDVMTLWSLGLIPVPLDFKSSPERLSKIASKTEAKLLLGSEQHWGTLHDKVLPELEQLDTAQSLHFHPREPSDAAAILFTSGTTGEPKGVVISYQAAMGNAHSTKSILRLEQDSKLQTVLGFQFVSALSHFLVSMLSGAKFYTCEQPLMKADLLTLIEENRANAFGGSPFQAKCIAEGAKDYNFKLQALMSSGDNLQRTTIDLLSKNLPNTKVFTMYGLTELGGRFCILNPTDLAKQPGSVGKPIPGLSLQIVTDEGDAAPPNTKGHVIASGDFLFEGYLNQATPALSEQGFRTGDMGQINEEGFLYLSGRSDNVFKCMGEKVSTFPITDALLNTAHFQDVVVMSAEDPLIEGRVPAAFLVAKPDYEFKKGKLIQQLRSTLPHNHIPRYFVLLDKVPRTGSGKPLYNELREMLKAQQTIS